MKFAQYKMKSPAGTLLLVASEKGLQSVSWNNKPSSKYPLLHNLNEKNVPAKILNHTVHQLTEYFQGKRKHFDIPLDLQEGTSFQKKVWNELSKIPFGKTCSYKDIALKIKNENAVRAVGSANGKNPISIIVPCHRVITSQGTLGGYAGGINTKTKLLKIENIQLKP